MDLETFTQHNVWVLINSAIEKVDNFPEDTNNKKSMSDLLKIVNSFQKIENNSRSLLLVSQNMLSALESQISNLTFMYNTSQINAQDISKLVDYISSSNWMLLLSIADNTLITIYEGTEKEALSIRDAISQETENLRSELNATVNSAKEQKDATVAYQSKTNKIIKQYTEKIDTLVLEQQNKFDDYIRDFEEKAKEKEKRLQEITDNTLSLNQHANANLAIKEYQNSASNEENTAKVTLAAAVLILIAAVAGIIFVGGNLFSSNLENISWQVFAAKFTIATLLTTASAILVKYSNRSSYRANEFRRQKLELYALPGLLAKVSEDENNDKITQANNAIIDYVSKSFGKTWQETDSKDEKIVIDETFLKKLAEAIQIILKTKA